MVKNKGYIANSRSVRSKEAINDFRIPLSMINGALISEFLDFILKNDYFSIEDIKKLKRVKIKNWKETAKIVGASEWHHTSKFYNKTHHYDLFKISKYILENNEILNNTTIKNSYKENIDYKLAIVNVNIWSGTTKHPKIVGTDTIAGVLIGDWLYDIKYNTKYNITARKVNYYKIYDNYSQLVKENKEFKNTKKLFNKRIKEKLNK